tara:strand:- start:7060 stop:7629 length:570 start_codon:yes stop_codon:yes gene_type:complete
MKTLLLINGPPGCGKDTAARFIRQHMSSVDEYKMSKPLGDVFRDTLQVDGIGLDYFLNKGKDTPIPELDGWSSREFQIRYSDWCIENFGEAFFGTIARYAIAGVMAKYIIVDAGLTPEAGELVDYFGSSASYLLQIEREGCEFDSREYINKTMVSDTHYAYVKNNYDLDLYEEQIKGVIREWELPLQGE